MRIIPEIRMGTKKRGIVSVSVEMDERNRHQPQQRLYNYYYSRIHIDTSTVGPLRFQNVSRTEEAVLKLCLNPPSRGYSHRK